MDDSDDPRMKRDKVMDAGTTQDGSIIRKRPVRPAAVEDLESGQDRLLGLECFEEMDQKVRSGVYARNVAHFIQEEKGELRDLSQRAVVYLLRRYKNHIFSDEHLDDATRGQGQQGDDEDPFFVMHSLTEKFRQLGRRIDMEVETETGLNKLFSNTHKEFLTLNRMGKDLLDRQKDLGLLSRERGGTRQKLGSGQPGRIDLAATAENPESRQKVLRFVEAFMGNPGLMEDIVSLEADRPKKPKKPDRKKRRRNRRKKKPNIKRRANDSDDRRGATSVNED